MASVKTQLVIEGKNNAKGAIDQATKQIMGLDAAAVKAGAALAATFSVALVTKWVSSALQAVDTTRKLAQQAGVATDAFSGLQFAAKQSGVGAQELSATLGKLGKAARDSTKGAGAQAEAFASLGISATDASGKLKGADVLLSEIADSFQGIPDGALKSSLAMDLMSESGVKLIPLLNGGSEGIKALTDQAQRLGLVFTDDTAARFEEFNDQLSAIGSASDGVGITLASELLPTLSAVAAVFLEFAEDGENAKGMAEGFAVILKGLVIAGIAVAATFKNIGRTIGGLAAAAVSAATLDFKMAGEIMADVEAENLKTTANAEAAMKKIWEGAYDPRVADAKAAKDELIKIADQERDAMKVRNDALIKQQEDLTEATKKELDARIQAEKDALSELDDIAKKREEAEKFYKEAKDSLNKEEAKPSTFREAFLTKGDAQIALGEGDSEKAIKAARESARILQEVAAAGGSTYGFAGMLDSLEAIENAALDIEQAQVQSNLDAIRLSLVDLQAQADALEQIKVTPVMDEAAAAALIAQMQALATEIGATMTITPTLLAPAAVPVDGYATGGMVRGRGTGTSDSIPAMLSNGEYVIRAAAVRALGRGYLDRINSGVPKFAEGGLVGSSGGSSMGTVNLTLDGRTYQMKAAEQDFSELVKRQKWKRGSTRV